MSFGSRMKQLRNYHHISRQALADKIGVTVQTIYHYENDQTWPSLEALDIIMKTLGCDANYLLQDVVEVEPISFTTSLEEQKMIRKYRKLAPDYQKLIQVIINYLFKNKVTFDQNDKDRIIKIPAIIKDSYPIDYELIVAVGDSLEPLFPDGTVLVIKPTEILNVGDIGFFKYKDRDFVRKYQGDHLESLNPKYEDIKLNSKSQIEILGKVVSKL